MYTDGHKVNGAACLRKKGGPSSDPSGLREGERLLSAINRTFILHREENTEETQTARPWRKTWENLETFKHRFLFREFRMRFTA